MENNVNVRVIEENRAEISKFGTMFAKGVFTPSKENVILDFGSRSQQAAENNGLFLNRNIVRHKVDVVNIIGLNYEKDIDGEDSVIVTGIDASGKTIKVPCQASSSKFTKDATEDALRDALSVKTPTFFNSGKKVKEAVNRINNKELAKIEALISELEDIRANIKRTITDNEVKIDAYYKQLDNKDVEINVHVTD